MTIAVAALKLGNQPATVNRYLATIRNLLRIARDEWQWVEVIPKIRLLSGENQRDCWLTQEEADRLIAAAAPHLKALIRFALATGCRAREITGLEWDRVDLKRKTAWLDQGGWKSRVMVDRYAKFATEHLTAAAERIERGRDANVTKIVSFLSRSRKTRDQP